MTAITRTLAGDLPDIGHFDNLAYLDTIAPPSAEPPRPLYRAPTVAEAFPIGAMGPVLSPVVRAIAEITQAPDGICGNSVLAAASLAVQAHADVKLPGSGMARPTTLFILTIADSGERKTTADGYALEGVRTRESELRELEKAALQDYRNRVDVYERDRKEVLRKTKPLGTAVRELDALGPPPVKPAKPILRCSEPTIEGLVKLMAESQPTLGVFSSEGGSFIGGHAMNDEARLRSGAVLNGIWDGMPIDRVRARDGTSVLVGKRVALHLLAQPQAASRFLTDPTLRDLGLLGRFLLSAPAPKAGTRPFRDPTVASLSAVDGFADRIAHLLRTIPATPEDGRLRTVRLSDEARRIFVGCYNRTESEMRPGGKLAAIKAFASKMAEHAARIAGAISLVADPGAREISPDAMRGGFQLADYYAGEALRLADGLLVSEELLRAERLRRWLMERGRSLVHLAEIYQCGPAEIRTAAKARAAMNVLQEHGYVVARENVVVDGVTHKQGWSVDLTGNAAAVDVQRATV